MAVTGSAAQIRRRRVRNSRESGQYQEAYPCSNAFMLTVGRYPRGATLGGSAIVNAMASVLPNDADWNYIAALTGDASWS
jgi:choline dehydrogenase-like flavoprotein